MPLRPTMVAVSLAVLAAVPSSWSATVGDTSIAKWQDGKKAVFLLMFDDSWLSHYQVAMPELVKRGMIGTFYINPGKGEYKAIQGKWDYEVWKTGMVYGNHTMTHRGVKNMENAEVEIGGCTDYILNVVPGKKPRLISWAMPGVPKGKWNISRDQLNTILEKHHLINRPPFKDHGAVYHMQTAEQMLALADKAIDSGGMEYLVIHGLERRPPMSTNYQDFWPLNQDVYRALLDGLQERRDRGDLWITDHISWYQYDKERESAKVKALKANDSGIELSLTCAEDPQFFDHSLTLVTQVPSNWQQCRITQGDQTQDVAVEDGAVRFHAMPGNTTIKITPSTGQSI